MTHEDRPTFLDPLTNVHAVFGKRQVFHVAPGAGALAASELAHATQQADQDVRQCIIGVTLNPLRELISRVPGVRSAPQGSLRSLSGALESAGYRVVDKVAVFPNFGSARFLLPFSDHDSHQLLFREILLPRRYSLPLPLRLLIWVYAAVLSVTRDASFLFRDVYLLAERT